MEYYITVNKKVENAKIRRSDKLDIVITQQLICVDLSIDTNLVNKLANN